MNEAVIQWLDGALMDLRNIEKIIEILKASQRVGNPKNIDFEVV